MQAQKRRWGDRWDGKWLRDMDSMHVIMPYIMPNRADNEAFIKIKVDMTNMLAYLNKKNEGLDKADRYTFFHVISSAIVKTVVLRPQLNRFIKGKRLYQRNYLSLGFTVKKQFRDDAHESLAFLKFGDDTTINSLHEKLLQEIRACKKEESKDSTQDAMDFLKKVPRPLMMVIFKVLHMLDFFGKVPRSLIVGDPNFASVFMTNLGSIGLEAGYHHLNNWGTNSVFLVIGEKKDELQLQPDGSVKSVPVIEFGLILDERIADGYYYAKSVKLFKHLLENPELLEKPATEEVAL